MKGNSVAKKTTTNNLTRLEMWGSVILVSVGVAWGALTMRVGKMDEQGCNPAQGHNSDIAVTQAAIVTIKETMTEIKNDHKQFQTSLLERLKLPPTETDPP